MVQHYIPVARPDIGPEEIEAVLTVLRSGMLAQGKQVAALEEGFAKMVGVEHAIAVNSGTAALHLALLALGVQPGDEVITTPFTFWASASAVMMCGAKPVFVDIDPISFNIDPSFIEAAITSRTVGILPVHLFGQPACMDAINMMAQKHGLWVLEDACQAHGATYQGTQAGALSTAAAFSFYPTKNIAVAGEGGMVTTNETGLARFVELGRQHGMEKRYYHDVFGYNNRMSDVAAAMGVVQLGRLAAMNAVRAQNAAFLTQQLSGVEGLVLPTVADGRTSSWHQYTVRLLGGQRDALVSRLAANGIGTGIFYPLLVTHQPAYRDWMGEHGYPLQDPEDTPLALQATDEVLSLPVHPGLTDDDLERIIEAVRTGL